MKETLKKLFRLFKKKPVIVEAFEWDGKVDQEISKFLSGTPHYTTADGGLCIQTAGGNMTADPGDFVIKGTDGKVYPCKPGPFWETYEEIKDE